MVMLENGWGLTFAAADAGCRYTLRGLHFKVEDFIGLVHFECYSQNEVVIIGILVLWKSRLSYLEGDFVAFLANFQNGLKETVNISVRLAIHTEHKRNLS